MRMPIKKQGNFRQLVHYFFDRVFRKAFSPSFNPSRILDFSCDVIIFFSWNQSVIAYHLVNPPSCDHFLSARRIALINAIVRSFIAITMKYEGPIFHCGWVIVFTGKLCIFVCLCFRRFVIGACSCF